MKTGPELNKLHLILRNAVSVCECAVLSFYFLNLYLILYKFSRIFSWIVARIEMSKNYSSCQVEIQTIGLNLHVFLVVSLVITFWSFLLRARVSKLLSHQAA